VDEVRIDPSILLFGLGISVVTGVLFGLAPAVRASRANLIEAIKQSVQPGSGSMMYEPDPRRLPHPACAGRFVPIQFTRFLDLGGAAFASPRIRFKDFEI
jgi:hypothetical protein